MDKDKKVKGGVFYTVKEDGTVTDRGIADSVLENEDAVRQNLIDRGVIRDNTLVRKRQTVPKGVFFTEDKDGKPTDEGIVDEMLENDEAIRKELAERGIINRYRFTKDGKLEKYY